MLLFLIKLRLLVILSELLLSLRKCLESLHNYLFTLILKIHFVILTPFQVILVIYILAIRCLAKFPLEDAIVAVSKQLDHKENYHYLEEELAELLTFFELVYNAGKLIHK